MLFDKYRERLEPLTTGAGRLERTECDKRRHGTYKMQLLAFLQKNEKRWVTSNELIPITHRFSACIKTLREDGHVIDKRRTEGGQFEYTYLGYTQMVRIDDAWKNRYYRSEHWLRVRQQRIEYDNGRCCFCKRSSGLQVHHWKYELFAERLSDVTTLCERCHEYVHENVIVAFPRTVSVETYNILKHNET